MYERNTLPIAFARNGGGGVAGRGDRDAGALERGNINGCIGEWGQGEDKGAGDGKVGWATGRDEEDRGPGTGDRGRGHERVRGERTTGIGRRGMRV